MSESESESAIASLRPVSAWSRRKWCAATVGYFLLLTAALSHGLIERWTVPLKSMSVVTVPLLNAWTIGWNADRALHGFAGYWDAPIFHPIEDTFAFSEPQPATVLVAPVVWWTGSAIAGYNAWVCLSLFLNGNMTALTLKRMRYRWSLQVVGGTAMVLLPVVHQRIDVLQLVPMWGIVWYWGNCQRLIEFPGWKSGCETAVSFAACFALCVHHSLMLSILSLLTCIVFAPSLFRRQVLGSCLLAVGVAALLIAPLLIPLHRALKQYDFSRSPKTVRGLSARPVDYCVTSEHALIQFPFETVHRGRRLHAGWFRLCMAVLGVVTGLTIGQRRRWTVFLTLTALFGGLLSLGYHLEFAGIHPWEQLVETVPGVAQIRSVYRFAYFVQAAIVLLNIEGMASIQDRLLRFDSGSGGTAWKRLGLVAVGLLIAFECLPRPAIRGGVPDIERHRTWLGFVREQSNPNEAIACLPFAPGRRIEDYVQTTRWMLLGLEHRVPMVNGYTGFFPPEITQLRRDINSRFPAADLLVTLYERDVRQLVVLRHVYSPEEILALSSHEMTIELTLSDPVGVDVYSLRRKK